MLAVPEIDSSCPRCGSAVPAPARFCPACGYAAARLVPGQTLDGKYAILEKVGEGGMGEVYKARHIHLDEIRIIKVTKPDALGEGPDPRRFQEEARMATLVRHPNVAALYDFSRLPDGSYYMVWEFIDGVTLEKWMRSRGPMQPAQALDVARQVLAGLSEIHAQGIVHRDLSPDNILVKETRDGRLLAKIIDLGIAKRVAAESLSMTGTGLFVGKLKYCSPEQAGALSGGEALDGRSDLYSFGVVLYEMLAGKPPFEAQTPEAYLGKHLHSPAPPLDVSRLPPQSGAALSAVVARSLEKSRARRFSSAREFAAALDHAAASGPEGSVTAALPPAGGASGRGRRLFVMALAAVLVGAAAAGSWYILKTTAVSPRRLSPTPIPTFAEAPVPTAPPTAGLDQVVVAPRIVELETPSPPPRPAETPVREAARRVEPTRPAAVPPAPPPTAAASEASDERAETPIEGIVTEAKLRRFIRVWENQPVARRAHHALDIAGTANFWVATHPNDSFTAELKASLPQTLRAQTEAALDNGQPVLARLFHNAYRQFHFSPPDPDLAQRVREANQPPGH
jgi:tRNA A-37 threonylcarbamoyl transferase component Bud32